MQFTAVLTPAEEGGFVAMNLETGTTTQGDAVEDAIFNLKEATALYLEAFPQAFVGHPLVTMLSLPESANAQTASRFRRRGHPRATASGF
jgi:predicted RNase H-like HicB family nuclease